MDIPIIMPQALTFLTTFRCSAACENCCFQCNPKFKKKMTVVDMKRYLDICCKEYPSIKMVVFSGGECTLLKHDLIEMISYASAKGMRTRIVTNGWWAKTYKIGEEIIKEFKKAGLDEINFSTGDEHQKWIPFKNIRNAAVATARMGLLCAINVETKDGSRFNIDNILKKDKVLYALSIPEDKQSDNNKILIEKGLWAPIKKDCKNNITYEDSKDSIKFSRCKNLFSIIPINPYGEVLACCGITCESNPYLRLGNINREDIKIIYERAFNDVLKLWLFTEGPASIASYILEKKRTANSCIKPTHACILCREIIANPKNLEILRDNVNEFSSRILLKYCML